MQKRRLEKEPKVADDVINIMERLGGLKFNLNRLSSVGRANLKHVLVEAIWELDLLERGAGPKHIRQFFGE
jgi:hypothetical protein